MQPPAAPAGALHTKKPLTHSLEKGSAGEIGSPALVDGLSSSSLSLTVLKVIQVPLAGWFNVTGANILFSSFFQIVLFPFYLAFHTDSFLLILIFGYYSMALTVPMAQTMSVMLAVESTA